MKKISLVVFAILFNFILISNVSASSATISVTSNKSRVIVGDTVTVTVKLSSSANLGTAQFDVVASSNLSFVSSSEGGLFVVYYPTSATSKSKTYTFKFKAKSSGTATVQVKNVKVLDYDTEKSMSVSAGKTSFTVMTQSELESTYSKNNNLSKLEIEGYNLNPEFNKDTLEYNLDLEYGTESINIITTTEDSKASVDGAGEIKLSQGINSIKIVVTAENGSTKIYTINANVKELDPINVMIDGNNYTVIRQKEFLPPASIYYQESTITINEEEVPAYYNSIVDFTLIGLKDDAGNTNLYLYKDGIYELYDETIGNTLGIYILTMDENILPNGYNETKINIGNKEIIAYVKNGYEYPIVYGLNLETGAKNLYKYDAKENSLQRFEEVTINDSIYFNSLIGMFGFIIVSYIIFIVLLVNKNKQQKNFLDKTMRMNIIDVNNNALESVLGVKTKKELKREKKLAKKLAKKNKGVTVETPEQEMANL